MTAPIITLQYLENTAGLADLDTFTVIERLRSAADILPFSHLLIGWHLPQFLLDTCRIEAERLGMRFLRWQPLLAMDKADSAWVVEGLMGRKVLAGPAFTFFCPNHPAVREAVLANLMSAVRQGIYQGFFLDRVRFPSPSVDPIENLACFCEHCCRKAAEEGLDLLHIRHEILQAATSGIGPVSLVRGILSKNLNPAGSAFDRALSQFLAFRQKCICDFLNLVIEPFIEMHLEIGLDCFSPSLATMVGQDLKTMGEHADWIKLMTYGHTNAPAGLPFELSALACYLINNTALSEPEAIQVISDATGLPLPTSSQLMERNGLASRALEKEIQRGIESASVPILAGIELVELAGVTHLDPAQIRADLAAIRHSTPAGLAISWDLMHIPLDRLRLVREVYLGGH